MIGDKVEQVNAAIKNTLTSLEKNTHAETELLTHSNEQIQTVLSELEHLFTSLQNESGNLNQSAKLIKHEIDESLVQFQFQDRTGQMLMHVGDSIGHFSEQVRKSHANGVKALKPLGSEAILATLKDTYTMKEEHSAHGANSRHEKLKQPASEITFF